LAKQIGLPVLLSDGKQERLAQTQPDVRRGAALLLQEIEDENAFIFVRERFPETPRAHLRIVAERGVGLIMIIADRCALLPLSLADAQHLVGATAARRSNDQKAVAEMLVQIGHAALEENLVCELELYVGAPEPAVLLASGSLVRPA
jgi:hypothetical protein